ncbi:protein containing Manganese/iron superoxide dismutase, C-terminal domain, partial [sediment metagenome]
AAIERDFGSVDNFKAEFEKRQLPALVPAGHGWC